MHFAAQEGHTEICKFLIEIVEDKNPLNNTGLSLLHCAANKGHLETYKLIMEHFKDKNLKNSIHGSTPLHYAANKGHFEMCKFLLGLIGKANYSLRFQYCLTVIRICIFLSQVVPSIKGVNC